MSRKKQILCRNFLKDGRCKFGSRCDYLHALKEPPMQQTVEQQQPEVVVVQERRMSALLPQMLASQSLFKSYLIEEDQAITAVKQILMRKKSMIKNAVVAESLNKLLLAEDDWISSLQQFADLLPEHYSSQSPDEPLTSSYIQTLSVVLDRFLNLNEQESPNDYLLDAFGCLLPLITRLIEVEQNQLVQGTPKGTAAATSSSITNKKPAVSRSGSPESDQPASKDYVIVVPLKINITTVLKYAEQATSPSQKAHVQSVVKQGKDMIYCSFASKMEGIQFLHLIRGERKGTDAHWKVPHMNRTSVNNSVYRNVFEFRPLASDVGGLLNCEHTPADLLEFYRRMKVDHLFIDRGYKYFMVSMNNDLLAKSIMEQSEDNGIFYIGNIGYRTVVCKQQGSVSNRYLEAQPDYLSQAALALSIQSDDQKSLVSGSSVNDYSTSSRLNKSSTRSLQKDVPYFQDRRHDDGGDDEEQQLNPLKSLYDRVSLHCEDSLVQPAHFEYLIVVMQRLLSQGFVQPKRVTVAPYLQKCDCYTQAGCSSFKEYVALAVDRGIVTIGGAQADAWIQLSPRYIDYLPASPSVLRYLRET
ncbi:hypothetical protein MIR68_008529 [Amoeboaphelidium protococcarum]|nr:hypothetical protein MIR68_008529 [Amoeboaphelidium protococcarum]